MKTVLTSFDFMQSFDFILTYKIYQTDSLTPETNVSTRLIMQQDPEKILTLLTLAGPIHNKR